MTAASAGSGTVTVTYDTNATCTIALGIKKATASVTPSSATYDGTTKSPVVTANGEETSIVKWRKGNADGQVVDSLLDAGTYVAEVQVTDTGDIYTSDDENNPYPTFTITPANISTATITLGQEYAVLGNTDDYTPEVIVKLGVTTLPTADYEVTYPTINDAGNYTVTISPSANGNLTGSAVQKGV